MKKCFYFLFSILIVGCSNPKENDENVDVVLIGGGIMSMTLANMLNELDSSQSILAFERLGEVGQESTKSMNNAGTGHAALCELNYTPELKDGTIDVKKAISINESYEITKQFWSYLVKNNKIGDPSSFINPSNHMSFVIGEKDSEFLHKRYLALQKQPLFVGMEFSQDPEVVRKWAPLLIDGRDPSQPFAATRINIGTDVNFESLTKSLTENIKKSEKFHMEFKTEVTDIKRNKDNTWKVIYKNLKNGEIKSVNSKFVFIGAGGATLPLLEKTSIPESKGYGGFPVSGQWLICNNPKVIAEHASKVYGKASVGSPPMSVPHLDTRIIDGKKQLMFGPFAGFSPKFLQNGSWTDLPESFNFYNIRPVLEAGIDNISLTKYLVGQVMLTPEERLESLKQYLPNAKMEDWDLKVAGQRVQVIKMDDKTKQGILQFGTEVVSSADGSIAAMLGASPGATTSVTIMLKIMETCFPDLLKKPKVNQKLLEMIPSYGRKLSDDIDFANTIRKYNAETLGLKWIEIPSSMENKK